MTGRLLNERLGKIHFWIMFLGFNLTFLPMFWLGLNGMNRRVADYQPHLESVNRFVSLAGFFLGISFIFFVGCLQNQAREVGACVAHCTTYAYRRNVVLVRLWQRGRWRRNGVCVRLRRCRRG